jgi:diguanylate cyclase (GGDEF)-like protein/PAS domain S-box-containing protein
MNHFFPTDFFQLSSTLMCVLDIDGRIMQINPAFEKKLNLAKSDIEKSLFITWVHPDDKTNSHDHLRQLGITSQKLDKKIQPPLTQVTFSNRWRDSLGDYYCLQWEIGKRGKDEGERKSEPFFYAVAIDITAQKASEAVLRDTEERFELAIQGSNVGFWDWNLRTNEIYLSARWKNILGYQEHEINNTLDEWCRFVHPDDFNQMWGALEAYLDKRIPHYEEIFRVYHKEGMIHWIVARGAAKWDANDKPYRIVGTYIDITERKNIEQAFQENEALLSAIFEVTRIGLCVTDEYGRFVRVNNTYCEIYNYSADELLGQHFTKVLSSEHHERAIKLHQALLANEPSVETEGEWHIKTKKGRTLDVTYTTSILMQRNGQRFRVTTLTDITKSKHLELERHRLFNLSLDMQSIIGFDISFKEVNAAWEQTLGWSKTELMQRSPMDLVHPDDRPSSLEIIHQLQQGKTVFGFENRYLCKDGSYKWLSWSVYPLVDQQTLYIVTRDITDRKRAEEEIRRQQSFIRLVVDSVPNLIFIKDHLGYFVFVNQATANFLGCSTDELVNHNNTTFCQLRLEKNLALSSKTEEEVIEYLHEIDTEESYVNAKGELRCFHILKKPFMQKDNDVLVLSIGTDITERKQHEKALKQSEARYRAIVEDQVDLISRFLPDGTLNFVNKASCNYFGKQEEELLGISFFPFLPPNDLQRLKDTLSRLTPTQPTFVTEHRVMMPDSSIVWQQWINHAMFDEQGKIIEYQGVGRDITQRKLAEQALRHSEERLRLVTSAAPVILFAVDKKGIFTFIRGNALSVLNLKDDELVGQSIFDSFAHLPQLVEDIHLALTGKAITSQTTLPLLVLETKLNPLYDTERQIIGVIGVSINITKRYRLELQLKDTVAELETILDNSVVGIAYVKNGVFVRVNRKLEILLCYAEDELCGLPFHTIYSSKQKYQQMEQQAYSRFSVGQAYDKRHLLCTKESNLFWARLVGKTVDANELDKGVIWMIEDITVQKRAEQHLRLTAAVFETSANAIIVTDKHNRIQQVNPAFTKMTGYTTTEVYGQSTTCLASGQHDQQFYQDMWKSIQKNSHWQGEVWNRKKNGEIYVAWLSISTITDEEGEPAQYMAILTDISSLQQDIENVRYLANYDSLTRLPNRLLFRDNLKQAEALSQRHQRIFALLFIDLDGFKPVNDRLGHAIGDQLLQGVAKRLQNCVRETDSIARLGGDEFTVILNHLKKAQDAAKVASDIVRCLQKPFQLNGHHVMVSASIGISIYPNNSQDIDTLIKQADSAMYEAKHAGKGCFCFYK